MKPRMLLIISASLLLFIALNAYVGWNGWIFISRVSGWTNPFLYWLIFWIIAFSYIIARLGRPVLPEHISILMKWIGSYWVAVFLYALLLLPIVDLTIIVLQFRSVPIYHFIPMIGYVFILCLLIILVRGSWNARNPIIRQYDIKVNKAAGTLQTLRIAAASDLHLGDMVGTKQLKLLVDKINGLDPDLILLPGDIIDDDIKPFIEQNMGEVFKGLKSRMGIYAVLGNHEYIGGHIKEFVTQMKYCGIEVLMDQTAKIGESFYIIGRKDLAVVRFGKEDRLDLDILLEEVDSRLPIILMDHQPYHLDKAARSGVDVMLSGHTHRGQMAPIYWITRRIFELDWGYLQKANLHAIVSSGYGTWGPPIRIGSRSEIIELIIHFKPVI